MYHFIDRGSDIMGWCNFALSVLEHCSPYSLYNKACVLENGVLCSSYNKCTLLLGCP